MVAALEEARALGFLGPGPVERQITHARQFLPLLEPPGAAVDLGSGGGIPGLVLAAATPDRSWLLLDVNRRRTSFLARTVAALGWSSRVEVLRAPAEAAAHETRFRGRFAVVVARSFAPPAVTAECAAGFLQLQGRLVVAEPPVAADRWPPDGLAAVGLEPDAPGTGTAMAVMSRTRPCPPEYPRQWREMQRHPLW